jgi:hypothetical protein
MPPAIKIIIIPKYIQLDEIPFFESLLVFIDA